MAIRVTDDPKARKADGSYVILRIDGNSPERKAARNAAASFARSMLEIDRSAGEQIARCIKDSCPQEWAEYERKAKEGGSKQSDILRTLLEKKGPKSARSMALLNMMHKGANQREIMEMLLKDEE